VAVVARAVLVMMTRVETVATNEVVVKISGDYSDTGCCGWHGGCGTVMIVHGTFGRGRSGCACNACLTGRFRGMSSLGSVELV
jgi:hypothetical protein